MRALFLNVGEVVLSYVAFFSFFFALSLFFSFEGNVSRERGSETKRLNVGEVYIYTHTYIKAKSRIVLFFLLSLSHFTVRHAPRESR